MPDVPEIGKQQPQEPEFADPADREKWHSLQNLIKANKRLFADLANMACQVDGASLMETRLNTFIYCFVNCLPPDERDKFRLMFEAQYEQQVNDQLTLLRSQVRQAMMAAGGQASPQQIAALARMNKAGRPGG